MRSLITYFSIFLVLILLTINTYMFLYRNEDFKFFGTRYIFSVVEGMPQQSNNMLNDFIELLSKNDWLVAIEDNTNNFLQDDWGLFNWFKPIFNFFSAGLVTALAVTQNIALLLSIIVFYISYLFVYIFYFFQALFV